MFKVEDLPFYATKNNKVNHFDYEVMLLDFIEYAWDFHKRVGCHSFTHSKKQDHGECDAIGDNYSFDFKLIVGSSVMKQKNDLAPTIDRTHMKEGFIFTYDNPNANKEPPKTPLHNLLFQYSLDDFLNYESKITNSDVLAFCKILKTEKNVFFYLPIKITTDMQIVLVIRYLHTLLYNAFKFRSSKVSHDTFISFICNDFLYILEYQDGKFIVIDKVSIYLNSYYRDSILYALY